MPSGSSSYVEVPGSPKDFAVLWDFEHYNKVVEMPLPVIRTGTQNMGSGVYWLKAGTPLSAEGAVANTSDAVCVVAEDFYFYENKPNQAKLVKVIIEGYVDLAEAEARSGLTYTEDALSALETAGVVMVDGKLAASGGGSTVVANPTLAGTEDSLTGLEVDGTKYSVGGGLPSYTNEDIGKTLTLTASGQPTTETVVTIEEQTVSVQAKTGRAGIEFVDGYLWQVGDAVHLTLNGTLYECVVEEDFVVAEQTIALGIKATTDAGDVGIDFGTKRLYYGGDATFTVSATIDIQTPSAAPAWVSGGSSAGGVLVVHGEMDYDVDPVGIKNVDASVADIVAFVRGGGMAFFEIVNGNIYPCVTAWLDDPYNGTLVMFLGSNMPLPPPPGGSSLGLTYRTITGVPGTPDTWTLEEGDYEVALASS